MSIINYSLSSDFSGNIREDQFHSEIKANAQITSSFDGIVKKGDVVSVKFFENISGAEANVLNLIIQSHAPDYSAVRKYKMTLPVMINSLTSNNWVRFAMGKFPGTNTIGLINYIDIQSHMNSSLTSYDIKVFDRANVDVICMHTLTNTTLTSQSLGNILYQPISTTDIECLAKINGGNGESVNIKSVDIWYGS